MFREWQEPQFVTNRGSFRPYFAIEGDLQVIDERHPMKAHSRKSWWSATIRRLENCLLKNYAAYYNGVRTHPSLQKDAPVSRPVQRSGAINSHAILGGLHHQYIRI